jgi:hypothetical protein
MLIMRSDLYPKIIFFCKCNDKIMCNRRVKRFQVHILAKISQEILCVVMLCGFMGGCQCTAGPYHPHLEKGRKDHNQNFDFRHNLLPALLIGDSHLQFVFRIHTFMYLLIFTIKPDYMSTNVHKGLIAKNYIKCVEIKDIYHLPCQIASYI